MYRFLSADEKKPSDPPKERYAVTALQTDFGKEHALDLAKEIPSRRSVERPLIRRQSCGDRIRIFRNKYN